MKGVAKLGDWIYEMVAYGYQSRDYHCVRSGVKGSL